MRNDKFSMFKIATIHQYVTRRERVNKINIINNTYIKKAFHLSNLKRMYIVVSHGIHFSYKNGYKHFYCF